MKNILDKKAWKWVVIAVAVFSAIVFIGLSNSKNSVKEIDGSNVDQNIRINTSKNPEEIIKFIKENVKLEMTQDEMKKFLGSPTEIKPATDIIQGYTTTEVWRYDFQEEGYQMKYDTELVENMLVDTTGLTDGKMKAQLFVEWSKGDSIISNSIFIFYLKEDEIYRYEESKGSRTEGAIIPNILSSYKQYNEVNLKIKKTIDLVFTPVSIETLKKRKPASDYIEGKVIQLEDIDVTLHFYLALKEKSEENADVFGFLEHKGNIYDIGQISSFGLESLKVETIDRTFDGKKEIQIIGDMGATYSQMILIRYDENQGQWQNLLTMGSPEIVDLDGDGIEELIDISRGSLPPYVDIYRWNNDNFEMVGIGEATGNAYAMLYQDEEGWIIKAGRPTEDIGKLTKFYKYDRGKLVELNYDPNNLISKPIKLPKFNGTVDKIEDNRDSVIEIPDNQWQGVKEYFAGRSDTPAWKERIDSLKITDFDFIESWRGTLNNIDFQFDTYSLDVSYMLIVEKYGDEIKMNLSSNLPLKAFIFYGDSVNLMMQSKGTNKSFNIAKGEFENGDTYRLFEAFAGKIYDFQRNLSKGEYYQGFEVLGTSFKPIKSAFIVN